MLKRIFAGAPQRKTRFHDELGNRIPLERAIRHLPLAISTGLARVLAGHRSVRPWISYDGQQVIADALSQDSRVLEFGSGMSTAWYARHAGHVVSIEDYRPWFDKVGAILKELHLANVDYVYAGSHEDYIRSACDRAGEGFDLIMVDGSCREECISVAPALLRPGGMIYLDNSDKASDPATGDIPKARTELLRLAKEHDGTTTFFTDFAPTQLFVQQGILVQMPKSFRTRSIPAQYVSKV